MSSSVFFRFKSQKEPTLVTFDGTGISVFELKREIINLSRLGDGTDFELVITSEDSSEEYDDDTSIIPRSTTVVAKRLPAAKPGRGGAARYVSGKMPQNAKNSHRMEAPVAKPSTPTTTNGLTAMSDARTEDERMAAVLKMGADQWQQQQQKMANAAPVHRNGPMKGKPQNVPDHPPAPGYVCYRCGQKGHWIMACPTNDDPSYDGRPRVKRTTGIPRSFLKTVEKPTAIVNDGTVDDTKQPSGVMVNAEGEFVIAEPDKAAWDQFQAKNKVSAAAQDAAARGSKELQDRGLECSIDKHLFVNPTKTPCCQKTFCYDCITNTLIDNDLRCPECSTDDVLIDNLIPDTEMVAKIRSYEEEKNNEAKAKENLTNGVKKEPSATPEPSKTPETNEAPKPKSPPKGPKANDPSRKRSADVELQSDRKAPGRSNIDGQTNGSTESKLNDQQQNTFQTNASMPLLPFTDPNFMNAAAMNPMAFPNMNMNMNMNGLMGMNPTVGMNASMTNPMMMPMAPLMGTDWNMWNSGFPQQNMNMGGGFPLQNGGYNNHLQNTNMMLNGFMDMNGMSANGMNMNGMGANGMASNGGVSPGIMNNHGAPISNFANQQRTAFSAQANNNNNNNEEDSAYFRKPVNPHRHQGRRNLNRPTDYREI